MKYIKLFERFLDTSSNKTPWDDIESVAKELITSRNWSPVNDLIDKNPKFKVWHKAHDNMLAKLSNIGIVPKRVSKEIRAIFLLDLIRECSSLDDVDMDIDMLKESGFKYWFDNATIKIYRGIPYVDKIKEGDISYKSFSLKKEYALKFTNPGWLAREFMPKKEGRNGIIISAEINPKDLWIFNNAGHEYEVISESPRVTKVEVIKAGEIINERFYSKENVMGKKVIPNKYVYHSSPIVWRESISDTGLVCSSGECYTSHAGDDDCEPAVFATNSDNKEEWFDSTYDDDVWRIDTKKAGVTWYKDKHFKGMKHPEFGDYKHIVTFENIPVSAIELVHKGTGKSTWD